MNENYHQNNLLKNLISKKIKQKSQEEGNNEKNQKYETQNNQRLTDNQVQQLSNSNNHIHKQYEVLPLPVILNGFENQNAKYLLKKHEVSEINERKQMSIEQKELCEDLDEFSRIFSIQKCHNQDEQISLNSKIINIPKNNMNLPIPGWMKGEQLLKNRLQELFGDKK